MHDDFSVDNHGVFDAVPSSITFNPDEWKRYVGSSDLKGHGETQTTKMPPGVLAEMAALVATRAIPEYRTMADCIRAYVIWGLGIDSKLLENTNPVIAAQLEIAARRAASQLAVEREVREIKADENTFDSVRTIMSLPPTFQRVGAVRSAISEMINQEQKTKAAHDFERWAADLLDGDGHV